MAVSKTQRDANKKWDDANMKYQKVKLKIDEYNRLQEYVKANNIQKNTFIRKAIAKAMDEGVV